MVKKFKKMSYCKKLFQYFGDYEPKEEDMKQIVYGLQKRIYSFAAIEGFVNEVFSNNQNLVKCWNLINPIVKAAVAMLENRSSFNTCIKRPLPISIAIPFQQQKGTIYKAEMGPYTIVRKYASKKTIGREFLVELAVLDYVARCQTKERVPYCPTVVQLKNFDLSSQNAYFDMNFMQPLSDHQKPDWEDIKAISLQLFSALAFLAHNGICHTNLSIDHLLYDPVSKSLCIIDLVEPTSRAQVT